MMTIRLPLFGITTWLLCATWLLAADPWPQWRGPHRDGISAETGLLDRWSEDGPPLAWTAKGLGKGYSSVAIANGRIYTLGRIKGEAQLICLKLDDGSLLWTAPVGGGEPNGTPTVDGNRVFGLGRDGDLVCVNAMTGEGIWRLHFGRDLGGKMMSGWGYSESPLVDGDRLLCTPGAADAMLAALDKATGKVIWKAAMPSDVGGQGNDGAAYSSMVISNACGVKQYVQLVGRGMIGVRAEDGQTLWTYNRIANGTANIPTPLVRGDYVFCSTGYGTGAALLKLTRRGQEITSEEVYFQNGNKVQNHHGGMLLLGNYVYLGNKHNQGFPLCLELMTGKIAWDPGRGAGSGSAAVVYADGHLYFRYEDGTMALIEATPRGYRLKGKFKLASINGKSWPHPVIADGKLYLRDQDVLMCYEIKN